MQRIQREKISYFACFVDLKRRVSNDDDTTLVIK